MATRLTGVVIDSNDPVGLARWWAKALGWSTTLETLDEVVVQGPWSLGWPEVPELTFVPVDGRKVGTNRVHLDLASDSRPHQHQIVDRLLKMGATIADVGQRAVPWEVLRDPEGNELCVLEPRDRYKGRGPLAAIVLAAADPGALAPFWSAATGWPIAVQEDDIVSLHNPSDRLPDLDIVRSTDPKVVKNRIHLDVAPSASDQQAVEVERLLGLGARHVDIGQGRQTWVVLADPEGNELCVLSPR